MRSTRSQGREARDIIREGGGRANKRNKPQKIIEVMSKTGETCAEGERNVNKGVLVQ